MKNFNINYHLWLKQLCCMFLALAMVFSNVTVAHAETPAAVTEEELIAKVNPFLKSYDVSDAQKFWTVESGTRFVVEATDSNVANERLAEVVKLVNAEFVDKEISANPHAMIYAPAATAADIFIRLTPVEQISSDTNSEEAYKITISENGVIIDAASENAAMYALRTIQALMITNNGLVYGTIVDYPDVAERRLHVDCGRKYFSKDWFIRQIRELSYLKMNAIQLHFAENLGFRIECETDPQIVSEQHLTKAEVREIIDEAHKYGLKVIPVLDTPGHVQHILKFHPEYGQVDINGNHSTTALDITNEEAVAYFYSLYDEYMELFKDCSDFHIGADEYMEYDRDPFLTSYQPVLDAYAVKKYGVGYTWREAMAGYTNDLAEYVYSKGFTPRIFNDGVYFNEGSSNRQKFPMHDYIGIDYWSRISWVTGSPSLQTFIDRGHKKIYNLNSSFFYYVLRSGVQPDGRPANSFDEKEQYKNIYNNWTPGLFPDPALRLPDNHECIAGAALAIWCDYPDTVTEDVVHTDVARELRSLSCKSWEGSAASILNYDEFAALTEQLGNTAGYEKGSVLPEVGEFMAGDDLGKIVLKFVDEDGTVLKADRTVYGLLDDTYDITPDAVYGYRFVSSDLPTEGTFTKEELTITLTYEFYTDKAPLNTAVSAAKDAENYIPATYSAYKTALETAKEVLADTLAGQADADAALAALTAAENNLVSLDRADLYLEVTYPVGASGYTSSSYADYQSALNRAQTTLLNPAATAEDVANAGADLETMKNALTLVSSDSMISVTSTDPTYTFDGGYPLSKLMDNNLSTFAWLSHAQNVDDELKFTFAKPVILNSFRYQAPENAGADIFHDAVVEISSDGSSWKPIGTLKDETDKTFDAGGETVQYLRIRVVGPLENWVKIAEVSFNYTEGSVDKSSLEAALESANTLKQEDYSNASWTVFKVAIAKAEAVSHDDGATVPEITAAVTLLNASMEALEAAEKITEEVCKVFTDVPHGAWYESYVQYVYDNGLMAGSNGLFNPTKDVTRAQLVTTLYRLAGEPDITDRKALTDFTDVADGLYYTDAVCWAYNIGVGTGNDGKFNPTGNLTRQQMAAFLYRFAGEMGYDTTQNADYSDMLNADQVSEYAETAVSWAVGAGLISGSEVKNSDGTVSYDLKPRGNTTRAQLAAILQRFCD